MKSKKTKYLVCGPNIKLLLGADGLRASSSYIFDVGGMELGEPGILNKWNRSFLIMVT